MPDWMSSEKGRYASVPTLTSSAKYSEGPVTRMKELTGVGGGLVKAFNATTRWPVENGQLFAITADSRDDLPDYDIMIPQWDILRMWRLMEKHLDDVINCRGGSSAWRMLTWSPTCECFPRP
ncbi:hypothetical protein LX32DRAFT_639350 [Colletotrichum zoysiae]|uniref:Uncharacterized protein n=1 Tax=Colletotrichum zoysiae TaxID=1216348 RepID=A0AAD9M1G6_9PEZI|nr:hypothetical protein LX32DRAFT_639350 [Colletotrichum zoysiae]